MVTPSAEREAMRVRVEVKLEAMRARSGRGERSILCDNGDGAPVYPPSKVLCKACLAALDRKLRETIAALELRAKERAPEGAPIGAVGLFEGVEPSMGPPRRAEGPTGFEGPSIEEAAPAVNAPGFSRCGRCGGFCDGSAAMRGAWARACGCPRPRAWRTLGEADAAFLAEMRNGRRARPGG